MLYINKERKRDREADAVVLRDCDKQIEALKASIGTISLPLPHTTPAVPQFSLCNAGKMRGLNDQTKEHLFGVALVLYKQLEDLYHMCVVSPSLVHSAASLVVYVSARALRATVLTL